MNWRLNDMSFSSANKNLSDEDDDAAKKFKIDDSHRIIRSFGIGLLIMSILSILNFSFFPDYLFLASAVFALCLSSFTSNYLKGTVKDRLLDAIIPITVVICFLAIYFKMDLNNLNNGLSLLALSFSIFLLPTRKITELKEKEKAEINMQKLITQETDLKNIKEKNFALSNQLKNEKTLVSEHIIKEDVYNKRLIKQESDLKELKDEKSELDKNLKEMHSLITKYKSEEKSHTERSNKQQEELKVISKRNSSILTDLKNKESELDNLVSEYREKEKNMYVEIESLNDQADSLKFDLIDTRDYYEAKINNNETYIEKIKQEKENQLREIESLKQQTNSLNQKIESLNHEKYSLEFDLVETKNYYEGQMEGNAIYIEKIKEEKEKQIKEINIKIQQLKSENEFHVSASIEKDEDIEFLHDRLKKVQSSEQKYKTLSEERLNVISEKNLELDFLRKDSNLFNSKETFYKQKDNSLQDIVDRMSKSKKGGEKSNALENSPVKKQETIQDMLDRLNKNV